MNEKADEFILDNTATYGLRGTNTTHNPPKWSQLRGHTDVFHTLGNHFEWGYNGHGPVKNRLSSTCMYYTDFCMNGGPSDEIQTLSMEMLKAAEQLGELYGHFVVLNRGRVEDYALVDACFHASVDFTQVVLNFNGDVVYPYDGRAPTTVLNVREHYLTELADLVVPWVRARTAKSLMEMFVLRAMDGRQVIIPGSMHLIDHNFKVGPANWALLDCEEDTAVARYDYFETGAAHLVHNMAYWSPELMAAQIRHQLCNGILPYLEENFNTGMYQMWKSLAPLDNAKYEMPYWWDNVQAHIDTIHDGGKSNEKWFTPLPALLDMLHIDHKDTFWRDRLSEPYTAAYGALL